MSRAKYFAKVLITLFVFTMTVRPQEGPPKAEVKEVTDVGSPGTELEFAL